MAHINSVHMEEEKGTLGLLHTSGNEIDGGVAFEAVENGVPVDVIRQKPNSDGGSKRLEYLDSFRGFIMLIMVSACANLH